MIDEITAAMREKPGVSVEDAKRDLLEFGEQQSKQLNETFEHWHNRVNDTLEHWHARIKHAAPYAAAAAAGVGFVMGKRRTRPRRDEHESQPEPEHRSARSMAIGWALRTLGPMALEMLARMRAKHQPPADEHAPPPPAC